MSNEAYVKLDLENILVSPGTNLDPVALGFVKEIVKEAEHDRALISGGGH